MKWATKDVDCECGGQCFTNEGSVERCATCLVCAKSSHGNLFVAPFFDALSSTWFAERMRHHSRMRRGLQFLIIARRSHSLKHRVTRRGINFVHCQVIKVARTSECVTWSPSCSRRTRTSTSGTRWVPKTLIDNSPGQVVDLSRVPDAVVGHFPRETIGSHAVTA